LASITAGLQHYWEFKDVSSEFDKHEGF